MHSIYPNMATFPRQDEFGTEISAIAHPTIDETTAGVIMIVIHYGRLFHDYGDAHILQVSRSCIMVAVSAPVGFAMGRSSSRALPPNKASALIP